MNYFKVFKMPVPMKITGRSSSITNAFVNSIIPIMHPSENDIKDSLELLGMTVETIECIYCGSKYTEWDHLRPLVLNKKPTGYISEIQNLVPSCGKCNQSKGNKEWLLWINSSAKLSPKSKQVSDLKSRIEKLKKSIPDIQLGTDIIVGFPGETKKDFNDTIDLAKKVGFKVAFVAQYSPRPNTASDKLFKDIIPPKEKKHRWLILERLINKPHLKTRPIVIK